MYGDLISEPAGPASEPDSGYVDGWVWSGIEWSRGGGAGGWGLSGWS